MSIKLKYPVVLCHGFLTLGNLSLRRTKIFGYYKKVRQILESLNVKVYEPKVSPSDRVDKRANELNDFIKKQINENKVHLLCHSMGGLDARFAASKLSERKRILSLTTISTPHHGSPFADWCVQKIYTPKVNDFINMLGLTLEGLYDLTTEGADKFNDCVTDNPSIKYFSFSSAQSLNKITPFLIFPYIIIAKQMDESSENDGLVPEISARWSGFVKVLKADHLGVLGYITMPNARKDFNAKKFYTEYINMIADTEKE